MDDEVQEFTYYHKVCFPEQQQEDDDWEPVRIRIANAIKEAYDKPKYWLVDNYKSNPHVRLDTHEDENIQGTKGIFISITLADYCESITQATGRLWDSLDYNPYFHHTSKILPQQQLYGNQLTDMGAKPTNYVESKLKYIQKYRKYEIDRGPLVSKLQGPRGW